MLLQTDTLKSFTLQNIALALASYLKSIAYGKYGKFTSTEIVNDGNWYSLHDVWKPLNFRWFGEEKVPLVSLLKKLREKTVFGTAASTFLDENRAVHIPNIVNGSKGYFLFAKNLFGHFIWSVYSIYSLIGNWASLVGFVHSGSDFIYSIQTVKQQSQVL